MIAERNPTNGYLKVNSKFISFNFQLLKFLFLYFSYRHLIKKITSTSYISVGDLPKCFLKTVLKYPMEPKPHNSLTSVTVYLWLFNSSNA